MARVDFYVLKQAGVQARDVFACRLAEKAYRLDNRVHIHTASSSDAARLDDLLWTFRDGSFVPHRVVGASDDDESPVTIGFGDTPPPSSDLLINLSDDVPEMAASFARIAELVTSDDDSRRMSRQRFAAYRDNGDEIDTHKL